MKVKFHYYYPINIDIEALLPVDVYIDCMEIQLAQEGGIRIFILEEPKKNEIYEFVRDNDHLYNHLLTFHEELLINNPKARFFTSTNSWIKDYKFPLKDFSISTVVGGKSDPEMAGYKLRHDLWMNRNQIHIPRNFYLSGNAKHFHTFKSWKGVNYQGELVLGAEKEPMFNSMFHVTIENTSIKGYFSEKIVDCFQTKTIPIYYGCKDIGDFFNVDGILIVNDLDEIIKVCNKLTPSLYRKLSPVIEENYQRSMKWINHEEQKKIAIMNLLKEYD